MNIGEVLTADCANGLGMRVSVFVSGCLNHCKGRRHGNLIMEFRTMGWWNRKFWMSWQCRITTV